MNEFAFGHMLELVHGTLLLLSKRFLLLLLCFLDTSLMFVGFIRLCTLPHAVQLWGP